MDTAPAGLVGKARGGLKTKSVSTSLLIVLIFNLCVVGVGVSGGGGGGGVVDTGEFAGRGTVMKRENG